MFLEDLGVLIKTAQIQHLQGKNYGQGNCHGGHKTFMHILYTCTYFSQIQGTYFIIYTTITLLYYTIILFYIIIYLLM